MIFRVNSDITLNSDISLNSINWLVLEMVKSCVFFAVRTQFLNIINMSSPSNG
jgi:hypothetical protein